MLYLRYSLDLAGVEIITNSAVFECSQHLIHNITLMELRRLLPPHRNRSTSASPRTALALLNFLLLSLSISSLLNARRSGWGPASSSSPALSELSASASSASSASLAILSFQFPINVVVHDFQALTRRVTAHHILLPKSRDVALALKQRIRNKVSPPLLPPSPTVDATAADNSDAVVVV
jgi:hypothetical protein